MDFVRPILAGYFLVSVDGTPRLAHTHTHALTSPVRSTPSGTRNTHTRTVTPPKTTHERSRRERKSGRKIWGRIISDPGVAIPGTRGDTLPKSQHHRDSHQDQHYAASTKANRHAHVCVHTEGPRPSHAGAMVALRRSFRNSRAVGDWSQ